MRIDTCKKHWREIIQKTINEEAPLGIRLLSLLPFMRDGLYKMCERAMKENHFYQVSEERCIFCLGYSDI